MQFEHKISEREYVQFVLEKNRDRAIWQGILVVILSTVGFLIGGSGLFSDSGFDLGNYLLLLEFIGILNFVLGTFAVVLLGVLVVFYTLLRWKHRYSKEYKSNKVLQETSSITLAESGIQMVSSVAEMKLGWNQVKRIEETKHFFAVLLSQMTGIVLPKAGLSTEVVEFLRSKVKTKK